MNAVNSVFVSLTKEEATALVNYLGEGSMILANHKPLITAWVKILNEIDITERKESLNGNKPN